MTIRRKLLVAALAVARMVMGRFPGVAHAIVNACPAAEKGMFSNQPGGASGLVIACTLTTATAGAGSAYRIEDSPEAVWNQGAGRKMAGDVDHRIAGAGIPTGSFVATRNSATSVTLNQLATETSLPAVLTIDNSDGRSATGSMTLGSNVVGSTTANFHAADVGRSITATSIPHGATITTFTSPTSVKIFLNATATGAVFGPTDVGLPVTGAGIPAGDYIFS